MYIDTVYYLPLQVKVWYQNIERSNTDNAITFELMVDYPATFGMNSLAPSDYMKFLGLLLNTEATAIQLYNIEEKYGQR